MSYPYDNQEAQPRSLHDGKAPRLARIRPNINKKAQQIIAAHMNLTQGLPPNIVGSSALSVGEPGERSSRVAQGAVPPVLALLDGTAPRAAQAHDISHLCDGQMPLNPQIPPSLIQESDHQYESSFMPKDATSIYSEHDGMWHTKVFPSNVPSSRNDAVRLDAWITKSLEHCQQTRIGQEGLAQAMENLVPILSVALHEIVRQVTHHCIERGVVLQKIWRTYVELFDRVRRHMEESLQRQRDQTSELQQVLESAKEELESLKKSHPVKMHKVIADLEQQFKVKQKEIEAGIKKADIENVELKTKMAERSAELELWYPNFALYRDSHIRTNLPSQGAPGTRSCGTRSHRPTSVRPRHQEKPAVDAGAAGPEEMPPEVGVAEDFKRLLAVLAPEKRKMIGKDLNSIMDVSDQAQRKKSKGLKTRLAGVEDEETKSKREKEEMKVVENLQAEVQAQESHIRQLRKDIMDLEALISKNSESQPAEPSG